MTEHPHDEHRDEPRRGIRAGKLVFGAFILIAVYFLITEHRAHLVEFLPYALLLACPLVHMFHGHGGHGGGKGRKQ